MNSFSSFISTHIKSACVLIILQLITFQSFAHLEDDERKKPTKGILHHFTWRATFLNGAIGMPPHFINGRLHPGVDLGFQSDLFRKNKKNKIDYTLLAGYFSVRSLQSLTYLKPGIGYAIKVYKSTYIRPNLNVSAMYVRQINEEFKFVSPGKYEIVRHARFQVMPSLGVEALISISKIKARQLNLILGYEFGMQLPFSEISSILPINQLHLGFQYKPIH